MTFTATCRTCSRSKTCDTLAEREAWIKYHNAVWPSHSVERIEEVE
jgi:hypothetical protein